MVGDGGIFFPLGSFLSVGRLGEIDLDLGKVCHGRSFHWGWGYWWSLLVNWALVLCLPDDWLLGLDLPDGWNLFQSLHSG